MNKHPLVNAGLASLYIVGIVSLIQVFSRWVGEETILIPMTMLSLFVLSAAVMVYLFIYHPVRLYIENQAEYAVTFFVKTVGYFAVITALFVVALLMT